MKFKILFFALVFSTFWSCSEIPTMPPERTITTNRRVILIEDLTGVRCSNCASAQKLIEEQVALSNGRIVVLGIHGIALANPLPDSKYDFRYEDAQALELSYDLVGKPSATFNRVSEGGFTVVEPNANFWQPFIDAELEKPQVAEIEVTSDFSLEDRTTTIEVEVKALSNLDGPIDVHVAIAESHLIDPQDSDIIGAIDDDFEHNHVLKEFLTDIKGNQLAADGMTADETLTASFTYVVPAPNNGEWTPENMEIITFITSRDLDGEVLHANQIHLAE